MASPQDKPIVRIAPNNPIFDLPVIVGIDEGLFDQAGLDVQFSATYEDHEKDRMGRWSSLEPGQTGRNYGDGGNRRRQ